MHVNLYRLQRASPSPKVADVVMAAKVGPGVAPDTTYAQSHLNDVNAAKPARLMQTIKQTYAPEMIAFCEQDAGARGQLGLIAASVANNGAWEVAA